MTGPFPVYLLFLKKPAQKVVCTDAESGQDYQQSNDQASYDQLKFHEPFFVRRRKLVLRKIGWRAI